MDAIRQIDVLNQGIAAAETAIQTLAATTSAKAEALYTAAQAAAASVNERLSALERSMSSGTGGAEALNKARQLSFAIITAIIGVAGIVITLIWKSVTRI